jgi:hypothetical protein
LNLKPGQNGKLILISRGSYIDINIYIYSRWWWSGVVQSSSDFSWREVGAPCAGDSVHGNLDIDRKKERENRKKERNEKA